MPPENKKATGKVENTPTPNVEELPSLEGKSPEDQVKELAKMDRDALLEHAKKHGKPIKQKVLKGGKIVEITAYSLRPLLKPEEPTPKPEK